MPSRIPSDPDPEPRQLPPFLNKSFSLHRVSPLYLGPGGNGTVSPARCEALSRKLRDHLLGEFVRGVQVGGFDGGAAVNGAYSRMGILEDVSIFWAGVGRFLGRSDRPREGAEEDDRPLSIDLGVQQTSDGESSDEDPESLWIQLGYERASYTAILLPDLSPDRGGGRDATAVPPPPPPPWAHPQAVATPTPPAEASTQFLSLPLMLVRMPAELKSAVCNFVAAQFDCNIRPLRLGTRTLVRTWEAWTRDHALPLSAAAAKDVAVTLAFAGIASPEDAPGGGDAAGTAQPKPGLGSIDVLIPAAEVAQLIAAGREASARGAAAPPAQAHPRHLPKPPPEEGWHWRASSAQPFMDSLAIYLRHHLALDLFHPCVRVTRILSPAFVLSDGRMKLSALVPARRGDPGLGVPDGVRSLVAGLVERALGEDRDSLPFDL